MGNFEARILELEHATIRPIGDYPDHCSRCRDVANTRELQAICTHPEDSRESIDITAYGDSRTRTLTHCRRCGLSLVDHG